jgi:hypothetical protein
MDIGLYFLLRTYEFPRGETFYFSILVFKKLHFLSIKITENSVTRWSPEPNLPSACLDASSKRVFFVLAVQIPLQGSGHVLAAASVAVRGSRWRVRLRRLQQDAPAAVGNVGRVVGQQVLSGVDFINQFGP